MEGSILRLLEAHGSLGYEQIARLLNARPGEVRQALEKLRERGLVAVLAVGELAGQAVRAATYWQLTEQGRVELTRPGQLFTATRSMEERHGEDAKEPSSALDSPGATVN